MRIPWNLHGIKRWSCQFNFWEGLMESLRSSGRAVEGSGFENRRGASYRGFESLLLRSFIF